jgi:hypothetical protein
MAILHGYSLGEHCRPECSYQMKISFPEMGDPLGFGQGVLGLALMF